MYVSTARFPYSDTGSPMYLKPAVKSALGARWGGLELLDGVESSALCYCVLEDEKPYVRSLLRSVGLECDVRVVSEVCDWTDVAVLFLLDRDVLGLRSVVGGSRAFSPHALAEGRVRGSANEFLCVEYFDSIELLSEPVSPITVVEGGGEKLLSLDVGTSVYCLSLDCVLRAEAALRMVGNYSEVKVLSLEAGETPRSVALLLMGPSEARPSASEMSWLALASKVFLVHLTDSFTSGVRLVPPLSSVTDGLCYRSMAGIDLGHYPTASLLLSKVPDSGGWLCVESSSSGLWHVDPGLRDGIALSAIPRGDCVGGDLVHATASAAVAAVLLSCLGVPLHTFKPSTLYDACCVTAAKPVDLSSGAVRNDLGRLDARSRGERALLSGSRAVTVEWRRMDRLTGVCFGLMSVLDGDPAMPAHLELGGLDGLIIYKDSAGPVFRCLGFDRQCGKVWDELIRSHLAGAGLGYAYLWYVPFSPESSRMPLIAGGSRGPVPVGDTLRAAFGLRTRPVWDVEDSRKALAGLLLACLAVSGVYT